MKQPTFLALDFRRHRSPLDPTQLPALPGWLMPSAPGCPVAPAPPAPPPAPVITPSMGEVYRFVRRLAGLGAEMPNNPKLGELIGGRGRSCVLRALRRLEAAAMLVTEHQGSQRRVTIMSTGQSTGWGEARPGHVPYIHRARGTPAVARPKPPRRANTRPMAPQLPAGVSYHPPLVHAAAETCQWPLWSDGDRPGRAPLFCGAACVDDRSYCADHVGEVYRSRATPAQPKGLGIGKTPGLLRDPRFRNAIVAITDLG